MLGLTSVLTTNSCVRIVIKEKFENKFEIRMSRLGDNLKSAGNSKLKTNYLK